MTKWSASCSFFFFRTLVASICKRDMRVTGDETQGTMGRRKRGSEAFVPSRLPSRANLYQQRDVWERGTQSGYLHSAEDLNTYSATHVACPSSTQTGDRTFELVWIMNCIKLSPFHWFTSSVCYKLTTTFHAETLLATFRLTWHVSNSIHGALS